MARLAVSALGAAIGATIGGPTGAQIGWMLGGMASNALFPENTKSNGPRLGDLATTGSSYGSYIPYLEGMPRVSGQVIWSSDIRINLINLVGSLMGGKGGPPPSQATEEAHEVDLLLLLSSNRIGGVSKVWLNGKLVYDVTTFESARNSSSNEYWGKMTVYTGDSSQMPDPLYEAAVGVGNACAYRGRGTIMFQSLKINKEGNIPNISVQVFPHGLDQTTYTIGSNLLAKFDKLAYGQAVPGNLYNSWYFVSDVGRNFNASSSTVAYLNSIYPNPTVGLVVDNPSGNADGALSASIAFEHNWEEPWRMEILFTPATNWGYQILSLEGIGGHIELYAYGYYGSALLYNLMGINYSGGGQFGDAVDPDYVIPYIVPNTLNHAVVQFDGYNLVFGLNGYARVVTSGNVAGWGMKTISTIRVYAPNTTQVSLEKYAEARPSVYNANTNTWIPRVPKGPYPLLKEKYAFPTNLSVNPDEVVVVPSPVSAQAVSLRDAVSNLLDLAQIPTSKYDVSLLPDNTHPTDTLYAMAISQPSNVRVVLENLMQCYSIDSTSTDKIRFRHLKSTLILAATIPYTDMHMNGTTSLELKVKNDLEIPYKINITYTDLDKDQQLNTQYAERPIEYNGQDSTSTYALPITLTNLQAKRLANTILYDKLASRFTTDIYVTNKYSYLTVNDIISIIDYDGTSYLMKITSKSDNGVLIKFGCTSFNDSVYIQNNVSTDTSVSSELIYGYPELYTVALSNLPLLSEKVDTPGLAFFTYRTNSVIGSLKTYYTKLDAGEATPSVDKYDYLFSTSTGGVYGKTLDISANVGTSEGYLQNVSDIGIFDERSYMHVEIYGPTGLTSTTRDVLLNNATTNLLLVDNELVQFRDAELISSNTYKLSGFLRGRFGTEEYKNSHSYSSTPIYLLTENSITFKTFSSVDYNKNISYINTSRSISYLDVEYKYNASISLSHLKPFSPVNCRADRSTPDTVITWNRRSRYKTIIGGPSGIVSPLAEASELYEVEVYSSNTFTTIKRTITGITTPSVTYTSAQQLTDFGNNQSILYLRIYQVSDIVGRGKYLQVTV